MILSMEKLFQTLLNSEEKIYTFLTSFHEFIQSNMPNSTAKDKFELQTQFGLYLVESYQHESDHTEQMKLWDMLQRNVKGILHDIAMLLHVFEEDLKEELKGESLFSIIRKEGSESNS